jgi:hypothetical protein
MYRQAFRGTTMSVGPHASGALDIVQTRERTARETRSIAYLRVTP